MVRKYSLSLHEAPNQINNYIVVEEVLRLKVIQFVNENTGEGFLTLSEGVCVNRFAHTLLAVIIKTKTASPNHAEQVDVHHCHSLLQLRDALN